MFKILLEFWVEVFYLKALSERKSIDRKLIEIKLMNILEVSDNRFKLEQEMWKILKFSGRKEF